MVIPPLGSFTVLWCTKCHEVVSVPHVSAQYNPVCPSDKGNHELVSKTARVDMVEVHY